MTHSLIPISPWVALLFAGVSTGCNPSPDAEKPATSLQAPSSASKENQGPISAPAANAQAAGGGARGEIEALCAKSCATTEPLGCLSATLCKRQCLENFVLPVCQKQFLAVLTCSANQPTEAWSCAPHGAPVMKDTVCVQEQETAMACLASKLPSR